MKFVMNNMLLLCFLSTVLIACKKDKDDLKISGFTIYDGAGNLFSQVGPKGEDWTFSNHLSGKELDLFNFMPAGITLDSTQEGTTSEEVRPVPNPVAHAQQYFFGSSEKVIIKVVVVNSKFDVLAQTALKFKGNWSLAIDFSDRTRFPNGTSYRVYYSYSAAGKPNFKSGYGDIRICENPGTWEDCFR